MPGGENPAFQRDGQGESGRAAGIGQELGERANRKARYKQDYLRRELEQHLAPLNIAVAGHYPELRAGWFTLQLDFTQGTVKLWFGPKQEYLRDGITESIITAVSKIRNLFVIARNSTFTYKGKAVKVQQVAEDLGVQYVLEGSVQRSGDRLRITAQLIDALSGRHIWSQRYDRELTDLYAMQDDITMEILQAMRVKLTEGAQVLMAKHPSNIEAALKAYEAHGYVLRFSPEANAMAKKLGEEVVAIDPGWGEGYYILSEAHMMDVWLWYDEISKRIHWQGHRAFRKGYISGRLTCASSRTPWVHLWHEERV